MYKRKIRLKLLFFVIAQIIISSAYCQQTTVVVSNSPENPGKEVNVKWISDNIVYPEGVNVYRREENIPFWTKLNTTPVKQGDYIVPARAFLSDTTLQAYIDMAKNAKPGDIKDMVKVFYLLKSVYSNEFARFIGIEYDDTTVVEGKTYRYMVKRIKGSNLILESISESIKAGPFVPADSPREVKAEAGNKKVAFTWKIEDRRFHSVNIYRRLESDGEFIKVNPEPVILAKRPGPDGKEAYPDVYFTDKSVLNDTSYYYYLTGIDFFGRETAPSDIVMAHPVNRTPPPAAEYLESKVDLLTVDLQWSLPINKKITAVSIYRSPSIYKPFECITPRKLSPYSVRYTDKLDKPGNYYYYVVTEDKNGNQNKSNLTLAQLLDIYPPAAPRNLSAVADSAQIALSWDPVADDHLGGYRIFRTVDVNREDYYVLLNAEPLKDTFYIDKLPFNARNKFFYRVVALDTALNKSDYSNIATAVLPDVTPPDAPFITNVKEKNNALVIDWLPNLEPDLSGYNLFRETTIDTVVSTTKVNPGLIPGTKTSFVDVDIDKDVLYKYYLVARDSAGNRSAVSNKFQATINTQPVSSEVELQHIDVKYAANKNEVSIKWDFPSGSIPKGVVIFRRAEGDGKLMPVSGLIREKEFTDKLPDDGAKFFYRIFSYSNTGEKWNSKEFVVDKIIAE